MAYQHTLSSWTLPVTAEHIKKSLVSGELHDGIQKVHRHYHHEACSNLRYWSKHLQQRQKNEHTVPFCHVREREREKVIKVSGWRTTQDLWDLQFFLRLTKLPEIEDGESSSSVHSDTTRTQRNNAFRSCQQAYYSCGMSSKNSILLQRRTQVRMQGALFIINQETNNQSPSIDSSSPILTLTFRKMYSSPEKKTKQKIIIHKMITTTAPAPA